MVVTSAKEGHNCVLQMRRHCWVLDRRRSNVISSDFNRAFNHALLANADVIINSHNTHDQVGIAKGFWLWMDQAIADKILVCPKRIFDEVIKNVDGRMITLLLWMEPTQVGWFLCRPTPHVDKIVTGIGDWVGQSTIPHCIKG